MSYISQSPQVYHYNQQVRTGNISQLQVQRTTPTTLMTFNPNYTAQNNYTFAPPPALNRFGESQIERVYQPLVQANLQPAQNNPNQIYTNFTQTNNQIQTQNPPSVQTQQPKNQPQSLVDIRVSQDVNSTINRYDSYLANNKSYKYNLFSMIDQPWNSCLRGQTCGSFPGNECIASGPFVNQ